jgi:pyruvate dehydrogenase E1 component alpha subunit
VLNTAYDLVQVLNQDGDLVGEKGVDLPDGRLRELYRYMLFGRKFDERALRLQRQGRIGTYTSLAGQEAAQVGSAHLLQEGDWMFSSYRDSLARIVFGQDPRDILLSFGGNGEGGRGPANVNIFPIALQIASQLPQAAGCAWAQKLKGEGGVTICYFGDGATSQGDFHEALNFASVFKVPCVFLCQNNGWAISVPTVKQMASPTVAQKAVAYGMEGVRVDGNDLLAVREVVEEAISHARAGEGPVLVEALTYRVSPHSTSDDPTRYHDPEVREEWAGKRDPIKRFRSFLEKRDLWGEEDEQRVLSEINEEVSAAVEAYEATPKTGVEQLIAYTYAKPTEELLRQRESARSFSEAGEG